MALAPAFSILLATSTQFIVLLSQPLLILTVTGISTALTTDLTIFSILSGSFNNDAPACDFKAILGTGHPIFISKISGCINSTIFFAAITNESSSLPNIC